MKRLCGLIGAMSFCLNVYAGGDIQVDSAWSRATAAGQDTAMVDLRSVEVFTEGVHVIRLDNALLVKKLQRLPGRVLRVSSENTDYAPFEIKGSEESERDFQIIGRVVWGGVTIK